MNLEDVVKQGNIRVSKQDGGPRPSNRRKFAGLTEQHLAVQGVSIPKGDREIINVMHPSRASTFKRVGSSVSAPDSSTASLMVLERKGGIPFIWGGMECSFNLYLNLGVCSDLTDAVRGWDLYALVMSGVNVTNHDAGDLMGWEDDGPREHSLDIEFASIFAVGKLNLGENADSYAAREIVDIAYGSILQCGSCGVSDNGAQRIYALVATSGSGSPGLPAKVIYSVNGGGVWAESTITGIGATETVEAIEVMGGYVVVLGSYHYYYAAINPLTGVPGTWAQVDIGDADDAPQDMYADGSNLYFAGINNFIYQTTSIPSGATTIYSDLGGGIDLARIHGNGEQTVVAVGQTGTVLVSQNSGATWGTVTTAPTADNLTAVAVLDTMYWWVGDDAGGVFYTTDAGESWTEVVLQGSITAIQDITFYNEEVGYVAYTVAGPTARLASTWDGGVNWALSSTSTGPRLNNMPVADRINRIAVPQDTHPTVGANHVALAGLAGDGSDGVLIIGAAAFQ